MKAISKNWFRWFIALILLSACSSRVMLSPQYCFSGNQFSTGGHVYSTAMISILSDSSFKYIDEGFNSRKDRRTGHSWLREEFAGKIMIKSDTIYALVDEPEDFRGRKFLFLIKGRNSLLFLDLDKKPLQKWRKCSKK